jgi:phosphoglycerate dehydrogenase-like enzyme
MTSASTPARIVLLGCGRWGRNILRDLLALGCRVEVVDPSAEGPPAGRGQGAPPPRGGP